MARDSQNSIFLRDGTQIFLGTSIGDVPVIGAGGLLPEAVIPPAFGSGAALTDLDADELTSGTIPEARLSGYLTASVGGANVFTGTATETITLDTAATFTDSIANMLGLNCIIDAVVARVQTAIATATDWSLGDPTTADRFLSATTDLAGTTRKVGLNHWQGGVSTDAAGPVQLANAKVRITTTGTPSAGAIRVTVFYRQFFAPTS